MTLTELLKEIKKLEDELDMHFLHYDNAPWSLIWELRELREELRRRTEPPDWVIEYQLWAGEEV